MTVKLAYYVKHVRHLQYEYFRNSIRIDNLVITGKSKWAANERRNSEYLWLFL